MHPRNPLKPRWRFVLGFIIASSTPRAGSRLQLSVIFLRQRETLLAPRLHPVLVHGLELALAEVVHNSGPNRVPDDVDGGPASVQEPVHGQDDGDVIWGQPHGLQDHHHCYETGLWYSG